MLLSAPAIGGNADRHDDGRLRERPFDQPYQPYQPPKGSLMIKRIPAIIALATVVLLNTGCAVNRATATLTPGADLSKVRTIYIEKEKGDDRAIDLILKKNLEKRGYIVTTGDAPRPDKPVDAALSYVDRWMWDITMYMLELTVTLRDPVNSFPMATGNSFHTSLTRKSPEEMVDEVLGNMLSPAKTTATAAR